MTLFSIRAGQRQMFILLLCVMALCLPLDLFSQTKDVACSSKSKVEDALNSLEKEFKGIRSISSDFVQTKRMSLFKHSITLKGRLLIKFPHYFRWEVDEPVRTTITAEDDSIEVWDEESGETTHTSTKNNPVVQNVWAQIDSWLMGKYALLSKDYSISILVEEKSNSTIPVLLFQPKSEPLSLAIKSVKLYFAKATESSSGRQYLQKVIIEEKSGDTTRIEFNNLKIVLEGGS